MRNWVVALTQCAIVTFPSLPTWSSQPGYWQLASSHPHPSAATGARRCPATRSSSTPAVPACRKREIQFIAAGQQSRIYCITAQQSPALQGLNV